MNCPFCGGDNFPGVDHCDSCDAELSALQVDAQREKAKKGPLGDPLGHIETLEPGVVGPKDSVADALEHMRKDRRGSVLVCEGDRLLGIFTERDLIRRIDHGTDLTSVTMESVMTPKPFTYSSKDSVAYALNGMAVRGNRHLPITDDENQVTGFISVRKVLQHIFDKTRD